MLPDGIVEVDLADADQYGLYVYMYVSLYKLFLRQI